MELDDFYSDDFHTIIIELAPRDKSLYMLMVMLACLGLNIFFIVLGVINYYF